MLPVAILAGGLAKRIRPFTDTIPKALIDINGEPFLAHQFRLLKRSGIDRVVLCVAYRGSQIESFAGNGSQFGLHLEYSYDGPELLGTAGAIRGALRFLGDEFFVLYGDSYLPCDYKDIETRFFESRKQGLMTVFRNEGQWDASNVEFSDGSIAKYDKVVKSPSMQHIDYGLGVFRRSALDAIPEGQVIDLATVYQDLVQKRELAAYEVRERFYEIGSFEGIRDLTELLSK